MILESTQPLLIRHSASDLTHFLACEALTALDLKALTDKGLAARKVELDESGALIAKKGVAHEKTYLQNLHNAGKQVVDIQAQPLATNEDRRIATENAMTSGVEVIYQATLIDGDLLGHADFLLRVETPSSLEHGGETISSPRQDLKPLFV